MPSRSRSIAIVTIAVALTAGCTGAPHRLTSGEPLIATQPRMVAGSPTPSPSGSPSPGASGTPSATTPPGSCSILPDDNVWRANISHLPVLAKSATYVKSIGSTAPVHADFGSGQYQGAPIGIPITTVSATQAKTRVTFQYAPESDKGPYPIPKNPAIEGGPSSTGDRHVILYDPAHCIDYELYAAYPTSTGWKAGSGAIFNLTSNKLRPAGWTSADAAGLPILPGLVTWADMKSGHIDHAIRVTVPDTQAAYIWPARHQASSSSNTSLPPMGLRLRLKASVDISHLPSQARIVAQAMKTYGIIVADNGSPWFISGAPDSHFNNDALHALGTLVGNDFEAVDESSLMVSSNSGQAR
ncbi:MAG TPA: hypothetical protein VKB59_09575 [Micromonosporaceae bacterium]|nr:hypothetical protein [Micromonosporaceae bacterium]